MYIVATISKNSYAKEKVREIIEAGATVLRYNFSHGSPEKMQAKIADAREVISDMRKEAEVKILADLPGNKIRLGSFTGEEYAVKQGEKIRFQYAQESKDPSDFVPVVNKETFAGISVGELVSVGDGELAFTVTGVDEEQCAAIANNSGVILQKKAFNVARGVDMLDHVTEKTMQHLQALDQIQPDWVAFSFVNSAEYAARVKELLVAQAPKTAAEAKIVAKIETQQGVDMIDAIMSEVDIALVARGDLGLTTPIEALGIYQKKIVAAAKKAGKQSIVSTQILDSIVDSYTPKRAEVLDLTNIVLDGADGIMLARETGISQTPGYSVEVAQRIISYVEGHC